jgi:HEAT repeat protein
MPDEVVRADSSYVAALNEAYSQGSFEEDHSAGHALMQHPRARAAQERFIDLAQLYEDSLRQVLRESRFAMQRALAAQVLGYLPDKQNAAEILAGALDDPSPAVRNDAARALWVIAMYAQDKPAIRAAIPVDPLIAMMKSLEWTDRNKASLVLMALTASRNSALLARLNAEIRPELEEMAAWRTQHAFAPYLVLGRITGKEDAQIFEEFQRRSQ